MSDPIIITATVACWASKRSHRDLLGYIDRGDNIAAIGTLIAYGPPDKKSFGDGYIRMGEADVTVRLIPRDEQTRLMVRALQAQLAEERVKWHQRQEALLQEISKLSALEFNGSIDESA